MKFLKIFKYFCFFFFLTNNFLSFITLGLKSIYENKLKNPLKLLSLERLENVFEDDSVAIGQISMPKPRVIFFKKVKDNYFKYKNTLNIERFSEKEAYFKREPKKFEEITKILFSGFFREEKISLEESLIKSSKKIILEESVMENDENIIFDNSLILDQEKEQNFKKNLKNLKKELEENLKTRPNLNHFYSEILKMDKNNFDEDFKETEEKLKDFLNAFCSSISEDKKITIGEDLREERLLELIFEYRGKFEKEFKDFKEKLSESFQVEKTLFADFKNLVILKKDSCPRCELLANHPYMNEKEFFKKEFFIDLNKNFKFEEEPIYFKYYHFGSTEKFEDQYKKFLEEKKELESFEKILRIIYPKLFEKKNYDNKKQNNNNNNDFEFAILEVGTDNLKQIEIKNNDFSEDKNLDKDSIKKLKNQTEEILNKNEDKKNYRYIYFNLLKLNELNIEDDSECKKLLDFADIFYYRDADDKVKIREDLSIESLINSELESLKFLLKEHKEFKINYRKDNENPDNLGACKCQQENTIKTECKKGVKNIMIKPFLWLFNK